MYNYILMHLPNTFYCSEEDLIKLFYFWNSKTTCAAGNSTVKQVLYSC
jgi:hypothetical protein